MKKVAKIKLPKIVTVRDYHDFDTLAETMNGLTEPEVGKIKVKELGFDNEYVGVMYAGAMPSKQEIDKLLKEEKITIDKDNEKF